MLQCATWGPCLLQVAALREQLAASEAAAQILREDLQHARAVQQRTSSELQVGAALAYAVFQR